MGAVKDVKSCALCGRTIEWRKKWAKNWDEVRYCSDACRKRKLRPVDAELEVAILGLLDQRARDATICPSEAARLVAGHRGLDDEEWRSFMEPARQAARRLVAVGQIDIMQKGQVVDGSTAKGPIRLRRK